MPDNILEAILVQGGLGTTAAVFIWLYVQERKDRKEAEKALNIHLVQDINDKITDRDAWLKITELSRKVGSGKS